MLTSSQVRRIILTMDERLIGISNAVQDINRNLLLLQGDVTGEKYDLLEQTIIFVNREFEAKVMKNIREVLNKNE